ncbi:hypothetical protein JOB18_045140 [Solea senegalensis]|uniref:Uncharacterized protein n=1 Tax=Solea senegalensis TaxID=28829 RepID=A0AAV6TBK3_SOLSE|nr:hypothetical protein JOB18_045140 [Solea senegalensis]
MTVQTHYTGRKRLPLDVCPRYESTAVFITVLMTDGDSGRSLLSVRSGMLVSGLQLGDPFIKVVIVLLRIPADEPLTQWVIDYP